MTIVGYKLCDGSDDGNDGNDGDDGNDGNDGEDGNDGDDGDNTPSSCTVDKWWYSCTDETAARRL